MNFEKATLNTQGSEWPKTFLLDELWLRTRRIVVHSLESHDCWVNNGQYIELYNEFKERGEKIKKETLSSILGDQDYSIINSESVFNISNQQLRLKLPFALAFGYSIGEIFYAMFGKNESSEKEICSLCALFNLGISLFDLLNDKFPKEFTELSKFFSIETLHSFNTNSDTLNTRLKDQIFEIENPDMRIILKIITGVYDGLYYLSSSKESKAIDKRLQNYLVKAYNAELMSKTGHLSIKELLRISKEKSSLPFYIIGLIASGYDTHTFSKKTELNRISLLLGNTFHLIDDLSDSISDFCTNDLNMLWLKTISENPMDKFPLDHSAIEKMFSNNIIEISSNKLAENILLIFEEIEYHLEGKDELINKSKQSILFYTRKWIS